MHKPSLFVLFCCLCLPALAAEGPVADDRFVAGGSVTVSQPVSGDLIVSGGSVDVDADVAGDVLALGGRLRLGAEVGRSILAAAGQLTIIGKVGHNVRAAGAQVEFGPRSDLAGNLSVVGGEVRMFGLIRGHVRVAGGRVLLDGPVEGDVTATSGAIELGPNARIAGKLRYRSRDELRQDPAARVAGGIERLAPLPREQREATDRYAKRRQGGLVWANLVWTVGLMALATALLAALPVFTMTVGGSLRVRPGASVLLGFAYLVCVPVAVLILLVTLIGIPLGLLGIALYAASMPVAYVVGAIAIGDWALGRWSPERIDMLSARILSSAAVLLILSVIGWIPLFGALIGFVVLLGGLGALLLQARPAVAGPQG